MYNDMMKRTSHCNDIIPHALMLFLTVVMLIMSGHICRSVQAYLPARSRSLSLCKAPVVVGGLLLQRKQNMNMCFITVVERCVVSERLLQHSLVGRYVKNNDIHTHNDT